MTPATFHGAVLSGHKEDAVEVPFDPGTRWDARTISIRPGRRGYPVRARIGSAAWFDSHVVARSRRFWLLLPAAVEAANGIGEHSEIDVELVPAPASSA
jgi:hypothetical protein